MLTQGFSQALQIPKDMCLKADEVVLQPKLAGSLQMCSLSLELPAPLNKSKKHGKKTEKNHHFFIFNKKKSNYALYSEELQGKVHKRKCTCKE